mgnify:CR=1 FL=1
MADIKISGIVESAPVGVSNGLQEWNERITLLEQEMKEMHPTTDEYSLEGVPVLCSNFNATLSKVMQHGRPELDNLPPINNANPAPRAIVDDG